MNTKLTLNVDDKIISRAKNYAKKHHMSLSNMIENYLTSLPISENIGVEKELSVEIKNMMGSIKVNKTINYRNELKNYLSKKYL